MDIIAKKLIDFGMDFQYENYGSEGEKIISFSTSIEVTRQNGKIYFEYCGKQTFVEENEKSINYIAQKVENACIKETT